MRRGLVDDAFCWVGSGFASILFFVGFCGDEGERRSLEVLEVLYL